ncbi:isocitrate/isopropylmalate dehydrogenase family protein [Halobaculum gomorrense]|uniref:Tartrate dehydrogenase/decarboxylase / D-malate dehydrogenase n=1 Tax=Halobaculum gomorrense TaxID=43928 RepID=A0A1M5JKB2_9EURY|nr:isocitrate/isopropylmalate family dehydrogenase [Halobaculum gomorrense]SHG41026.1 tartrate dehydrogenase/decarboxylase / D-malate dehydrogenase [Halobaculum gomorrense]
MTHDIALVPGDGIGPEVMADAIPLVERVAAAHGVDLAFTEYDWGSERYLETGAMAPEGFLGMLADHDAILLGAVGHPEVPDHVSLHGLLLPIRKRFDQSVCRRPSILFDGVESPLRGYDGGDIDFVVYRENTEGEYADVGGREHVGHAHEVAVQSAVFTRRGTERVVRAAFEAAADREGRLTSVTKSNAQAHSMPFWDEIVREVGAEYPEVSVESLLVDAAAMDLVRRPDAFDVIVASNLFGDVLTDIGAEVTGSMGLAPSANVDPGGEHPSMFEPVHGSAPDIAGDGVANPLATVLSASMLLAHRGEAVGDADASAAGETLWGAVEDQLADSSAPRTPDLGGDAGTASVLADLRDRV